MISYLHYENIIWLSCDDEWAGAGLTGWGREFKRNSKYLGLIVGGKCFICISKRFPCEWNHPPKTLILANDALLPNSQ